MKKIISLLVVAAFGSILYAPQTSFSYSNPLDIPDSWVWDHGDFYGEGDPYILKHNGIYYLYASTVDDKSGVKAWWSTDLIDWTYGGLVTEEPSTKAAYAPEVTYWNGAFYMYTSPGGNGHYVYKSSSPLGPFVKETNNLGMGIDGSVFIDDDGQWYFYSTGTNSIMARPMDDPYTFGEAIDTGASMNGWTEGSTVLKRNGKYFMTYTGNHIWNKAYRVDYGSSDSPIEGFTNETGQNPILINTEGSHVGLGHNSIVRGPDLDTHYMVYHSHANPGRETNLDRIVWNGDKMLLLGPTTFKQQNPDMPDFSDRFGRSEIGNDWLTVNGGNWSISNDWLQQESIGDTKWYRQVTANTTEENYTAEFNAEMINQGSSSNPRFGAVFSYSDEDNYGIAVLSPNKNRLETFFRVDGVDQGWETSELPSDYDYSYLHQIRVEKADTEFRIYVDGMLKQTREISGLSGGKIGYTTSDVHAEFGFIASSSKVDGSSAYDAYKPLPGSIEAVHYNTGGEGKAYHEITNERNEEYRQDSVDIQANPEGGFKISSYQEGEWLKYNANIEESGGYDVSLRVATSEEDARVRLWLDDDTDLTGVVPVPNTGGSDQWENIFIDGVSLPEGNHTIKVEVVQGEFDFASMSVNKRKIVSVLFDDFNDGSDDGWTPHDGFWKVGTNSDAPSVFDTPKPLPGVIEAAYYKSGGEGVAYHDTTPENIGGALRGDAVDIRNRPQGGTAVGWNQTDEWLKYNVNVKENGLYNLRLNAATTFTEAKVRLWLNDEIDLTGVIDVPSTGDWNNFQPITKEGITLPEGEHTITVEFVNGEFDFSGFSFTSYDIHKPLPGVIEAEDYNLGGEGVAYHDNTDENSGGEYRNDSVDIRSTADDGFAVENYEKGEWLNYNVDIAEEGNYGIDLIVASTQDNAQLKVVLDDTELTEVIDIPNSGDKNNWQTITVKDVNLPKGKHTLRVEAVRGEFDFSKMIFQTFDEYKSLPGKVMAVDYITGGEGVAYHDNTAENIGHIYRQDGVDIRNHPDGTYTIGWNQTGEWYKYNVNIDESGNFNMKMNVATNLEGAQVRLWLDDDIDLTGVIDVPRTGEWDNWSDVVKEDISLPKGNHSITVETVNGEFDFHSIEFYEGTEEDTNETETEGIYTSSSGTFGKSVIGEKEWKDYRVEADIKLVDGVGDGGIIFRVNNPANGMERAQNNPDFMQGYVAYLNDEGVHLGKQNYNWEYLTGTEMTDIEDTWQHMKVVVIGSNIKVYVGDMNNPKIDYTDNSITAFTHGKVGVRSHFSNAKYDNFLVKPIEPSLGSLQKSLELNRDTGNINNSLYKKLHNKLKQSQHHKDKGDLDKASKHLSDFLEHLEKNKANVPVRVYEEFYADANSLIVSLEQE
ncbi:carbohydrate-binding protein [Oceanobacillus bengalensis]|uniref:Carbohydrate-binding protein n=1 Tax=Oceanobacillus bengalensis TaxID=1435466 RepID=A0A494YTP1_9BACI|nr:carbohydrate-binding protein [Oceanobacillus bengalensis]RKQ13482.1 carbohydrate-binding protein [Oceanobacillus bengalensis]